MNARDELAELIWDEGACDWRHGPNEAADAILAAGYSKPRQVSNVEKLDALPADSVVRGSNGQAFEKQALGIWHDGPHDWQSFEGTFWDVDAILLPATVLYEPRP